jgi:hypothetical protein
MKRIRFTQKVCRECGDYKDLVEFESINRYAGKYRKRTCNVCAATVCEHYQLIRKRELALIPSPFHKHRVSRANIGNVFSWSPV